jgi:hypothetical protein
LITASTTASTQWRRASAFVRPSRPPNSRISQRDQQLEPLRAGQRKALEKTRRGSSARSNSIGDDRRKLNQQIIDIIIVNS